MKKFITFDDILSNEYSVKEHNFSTLCMTESEKGLRDAVAFDGFHERRKKLSGRSNDVSNISSMRVDSNRMKSKEE